MRVIKLIALFMAYLVISLSFFTAFVMGSLWSAEIHGQKGIPGIVEEDDTVEVESLSVMPCDVKADFTNNTYEDMTCGPSAPRTCTYSKSLTNISSKISATVREESTLETRTADAYVDELAPSITFSRNPVGKEVVATYAASDRANNYAPASVCSGIERVELLINNQLVNTTNHSMNECSVNAEIRGTLPNFAGRVNASLKVYDYIGLSGNTTPKIVVLDSIPPSIVGGGMVFKAGTKILIDKVSTNSSRTIDVDVMIAVEDNPIKTVHGDFTDIDKTMSTDQSQVQATCTRTAFDKPYNCTFAGLKLNPNSSSPRALIRAVDEVDNVLLQNISLNLNVLNNAGTVARLGPARERCQHEVCYLSAGTNEILAEISTSSTFNNSDVRIDGVQAVCSINSTWICKADVSVSGSTINLQGYDDLGNAITGVSDMTLVVDSNAPKRLSKVNTTPECPTSYDTYQIKFNVSEAQSPTVTIKANTLAISDTNETQGTCTQTTTGVWECVLSIGGLKEQEINTNINVVVEDFAGNRLTESVPISVCVEVAEVPELIERIETRGQLPKIDKRTASYITVKIPLALEIIKRNDNVQIFDRSRVSCSGTKGIRGQAYMINDDSLKPILVVPLYSKDGSAWEYDKAIINCSQQFSIRHGNKIYTMDEEEFINVELDVYNQPLGTPSEMVQKELKQIHTEINETYKKIQRREKIAKIIGSICALQEGITRINRALQVIKATLYVILKGIGLFCPSCADGIWKVVNTILSTFDVKIARALFPEGYWPPDFKKADDPTKTDIAEIIGYSMKMICAMYTCKHYDAGFYATIVTERFERKGWEKRTVGVPSESSASKIASPFDWTVPADSPFSEELINSPFYSAIPTFSLTNPAYTSDSPFVSAFSLELGSYKTSVNVKTPVRSGFYAFENEILYDGVMQHDWIVNPYKSQAQDNLCMPANLFNYKKEMQIKCMYYSCLEEASSLGLPLETCKSKLELDTCLYLEGAEVKTGGKGFFDHVWQRLPGIILNSGTDIAAAWAWKKLCGGYLDKFGYSISSKSLISGGLLGDAEDVLCGLGGTALRMDELRDFMDNPFNAFKQSGAPIDLPPEWPDACVGINYMPPGS